MQLVCLIFTVDVHLLTANDSTKHTLLRRMKCSSVFWQVFVLLYFSCYALLLSCSLSFRPCFVFCILSLSLSLSRCQMPFQRATATSKQSLFTVKPNTCDFFNCQNSITIAVAWCICSWRHLAVHSEISTFQWNSLGQWKLCLNIYRYKSNKWKNNINKKLVSNYVSLSAVALFWFSFVANFGCDK